MCRKWDVASSYDNNCLGVCACVRACVYVCVGEVERTRNELLCLAERNITLQPHVVKDPEDEKHGV